MAEAAMEDAEPIELTGTQKSAILMMLLGEEEAAEVLKNLSPREVQHLGTAMYSVQTADQETVNSVLDEFLEIIKKQTFSCWSAGMLAAGVLGPQKANRMLEYWISGMLACGIPEFLNPGYKGAGLRQQK